jgi:hypothetical protein
MLCDVYACQTHTATQYCHALGPAFTSKYAHAYVSVCIHERKPNNGHPHMCISTCMHEQCGFSILGLFVLLQQYVDAYMLQGIEPRARQRTPKHITIPRSMILQVCRIIRHSFAALESQKAMIAFKKEIHKHSDGRGLISMGRAMEAFKSMASHQGLYPILSDLVLVREF